VATVPVGNDRLALTHPKTGITVGLYPSSDPSYDLNLWRAASTQGVSQPTSSKFSELATLGVINGGAPVPYVDQLALTKTYWWYKVRSIKTNVATPSAFTTGVVSQPGILPTSTPGAIPFTGRPINAQIRLTTQALLALASTAGSTAGFVQKWRQVGHAAFQPSSTDDVQIVQRSFFVSPRFTNPGVQRLIGDVQFAPGTVLTGLRARVFRGSTKQSVTVTLERITGDAGFTLAQASFQHTTAGTWTTLTETTAFTRTVTTGDSFTIGVAWDSTAGSTSVGLEQVSVGYRMPAYHNAL